MSNYRPDLPKNNTDFNNIFSNDIFLKKDSLGKTSSPISSDLPSKLDTDSILNYDQQAPSNINQNNNNYSQQFLSNKNNINNGNNYNQPPSSNMNYNYNQQRQSNMNQFDSLSDTSNDNQSKINQMQLSNLSPTSEQSQFQQVQPSQPNIYSNTSPINNDFQNVTNSPTSDENTITNKINYNKENIPLSETSNMNNVEMSRIYSPTSEEPMYNNKQTDLPVGNMFDENNWKNLKFYITQIDMDIAWIDYKDQSNSLIFGNIAEFFGYNANKKPTPVVFDIKKAMHVADKICKLAKIVYNPEKRNMMISKYKTLEKMPEAILSSVEPNKFSYPIFGSVIFCLKFKEKPIIANIGTISKEQYKLLKDKTNFDIVLYKAGWNSKGFGAERAVIYDLSKVEITEVHLHKCDSALGDNGYAILKILSTSSQEKRFAAKYIDLLRRLSVEKTIKINLFDQQPDANKNLYNEYNEYNNKYPSTRK